MPDLQFPTDFAHLSEYRLRPDQLADFQEAATRIASAFNRTVGIPWTAYTTYAGPASMVYVLIPLARLEALDELPAVADVLVNEYGDAGSVFLRDYQKAVSGMSTAILSHLAPLRGRDGGWGPRMPAYLYYSTFVVRAGEAERFHRAAERIAEAHREHQEGLPWQTYATLAGEPVVHRLLPLEKLGELALLQTTTRILFDVHGTTAGAELLEELRASVVDTRSSVLQYLGHHSR